MAIVIENIVMNELNVTLCARSQQHLELLGT